MLFVTKVGLIRNGKAFTGLVCDLLESLGSLESLQAFESHESDFLLLGSFIAL